MFDYFSAIEGLFWVSAAVVCFAYIGYPLLILCLSRMFGGHHQRPKLAPDELRTVSLLISAHDEESCIATRVQNALASNYPREKLEIVISSDGSRDRTNEIVRRFAADGVRLLVFEERRGKAATLNASIGQIRGKIIVFSDANTTYDDDAIRRLVHWFSNPEVGAVCGKLVLTDSDTGRNADGVYWRYETFLKQCEGRLGGLLGANGAIYAMRRELYTPIPTNTIIDDFVIPLLAKLKHRFRIVYDATAIAHEESAPTIGHEFHRRVRIGSGDYQSFTLLWPLLDPRHGWTCLTFFCHKLLRWASPFLLLTALIANLFLLNKPVYVGLFGAQLAFYAMALLGSGLTGNHPMVRIVRASSLFCTVNAALFVGFCRWLVVTPSGTWKRTSREAETA